MNNSSPVRGGCGFVVGAGGGHVRLVEFRGDVDAGVSRDVGPWEGR